MAITGTTNTCQITTNTQFVLSGLTETNLSTISITDENGLDVSECFGLETNIVTVEGDNVTLTGDCDTSLEIKITKGITNTVSCDYTDFIQEDNGIITFIFEDDSTSDNIHPDCCTALGFTPEIDPDKCYYVCRWRDAIDIEDCANYTPNGNQTEDGWYVFDFVTGGTVTTVPSAECCYTYDLVEEVQDNGEIKCIDEFNPCNNLEIVEPVPNVGYITFTNTSTSEETEIVPTVECCTTNGYDFEVNSDGEIRCFISIAPDCEIVTNSIGPINNNQGSFTIDGVVEPTNVTIRYSLIPILTDNGDDNEIIIDFDNSGVVLNSNTQQTDTITKLITPQSGIDFIDTFTSLQINNVDGFSVTFQIINTDSDCSFDNGLEEITIPFLQV